MVCRSLRLFGFTCCAFFLASVGSFALADEAPAAAPSATPTAEDVELAKAHFRTGELNYDRGAFPDAAREFEEAYRLTGRPELLYNMGKSYDGVGDMRGALAAYRRFLATVKTSSDRPFVENRVRELEVLIAHVSIHSQVAGATVVLDGAKVGTVPLPEPSIELNPGEHSIEVSAEGFSTYRRKLTLARSQSETVDATLVSLVRVIHEPEKKVPIYKRWYLWTPIAIVVVAGVTAGIVVGVRDANAVHGPSLQLPKVQ
jgi:tetratricopeptide (TPR) repeat protein